MIPIRIQSGVLPTVQTAVIPPLRTREDAKTFAAERNAAERRRREAEEAEAARRQHELHQLDEQLHRLGPPGRGTSRRGSAPAAAPSRRR